MSDIIIKEGCENMDFEKVTSMLATAFWSVGIGIEEVEKGARNSALVIGAFLSDNMQIGYTRVISDKTRFAYVLDVFVDENHRNKGVARKMMEYTLSNEGLKDVYQWTLITQDAQGLYSKFGFALPADNIYWMEIRRKRPER